MNRSALLFLLWLGAATAAEPNAVTPDGGSYYGPLVDGLMTGHGEVRFANGRVYRGDFVRGEFEGKGRYETPSGEIFEGDFRKGDFTGTGRYSRKDGAHYEGEFKSWTFQGRGRFTDASGGVWEGSFVDGRLEGRGKSRGPMGAYEGEFKGWMFNGRGVLRQPNGDVYEGMFADNMFEGEGTVTYAEPKPDGRKRDSGTWHYGALPRNQDREQTRRNVETALYSQRQLLDKALGSLRPREEGRINLWLLAVAGDGSQEVFRREVEFVQREFAHRFGTAGHSLALVNSRSTIASAPMATVSSIREALKALAARMDRGEDILFLFLTSHASREHVFSLAQNGMDLAGLPAATLGALLRESGIRWKVVVVSACYSGGFIEPLQDGRTLIMTAARKDRASFGCADENDFTYFGRAYFKEALPKATSFQDAFRRATSLVEEWEKKETNHSLPQISSTGDIDAQIKRWWAQSAR